MDSTPSPETARISRAAISRAFRQKRACTNASSARTRNSMLRSKVGDAFPSRLCRSRVIASVEVATFARNALRHGDNFKLIQFTRVY